MDIVCCTDTNYIPHCGTMLVSLFENNRNGNITIHLLHNNLSKKDQAALHNIVEKMYNQHIIFYPLKDDLLATFPATNSYVSLAAYSKLFIANLLPPTIKKALYLDCDIIVVNTLRKLWEYDLTGIAMAAVKDVHKGIYEDCKRLNINYKKEGYYNSGVMMPNLDYWRKMNFLEIALKFVEENHSNLYYHDQDVLNGVLHGHILTLPYRYNLHDFLFHRKRYLETEDVFIAEQELCPDKRTIIHFSSKRKPWGTRCLHPLRKLYFLYLDKTEWRNRLPQYTFKDICWRWNRTLSGWLHWVNGYRNIK